MGERQGEGGRGGREASGGGVWRGRRVGRGREGGWERPGREVGGGKRVGVNGGRPAERGAREAGGKSGRRSFTQKAPCVASWGAAFVTAAFQTQHSARALFTLGATVSTVATIACDTS